MRERLRFGGRRSDPIDDELPIGTQSARNVFATRNRECLKYTIPEVFVLISNLNQIIKMRNQIQNKYLRQIGEGVLTKRATPLKIKGIAMEFTIC